MSEKIWYYEKEGQALGPVSKSELILLIAEKKIDEKTLAWKNTMENWKPVAELEELRLEMRPPPLPNTQDPFLPYSLKSKNAIEDKINKNWAPEIDGVSQVRPWLRFFAKMIDY